MYLTTMQCTFVHMHVMNERGCDGGLKPKFVLLRRIMHV